MTFPNNEANAFDAVWTASALADQVDTRFVVKGNTTKIAELFKYYYIPDSTLRFQSLHLNLVPGRILQRLDHYFAKILANYLRFFTGWNKKRQKILYARDPKTLRYFGLLRDRQKWLQDWILVYESHDPLGHDPNEFDSDDPFRNDPDILRAAANFDLLLCNTQALAEDLRTWSGGLLKPQVVTLASPLARLERAPQISFGEKISLGYIGTIDTFRGVDILIQSLRYLPENFSVRIVGRFRPEKGVDPGWLGALLDDPFIRSRLDLVLTEHISDVAGEIDRCDILVQTASEDVNDARYATPQKAFGYMVRGKPILVGNVPCHHELFRDGENGLMYELTPRNLAERAVFLSADPELATRIAVGAWEQSANYTYTRRAMDILSHIERIDRTVKHEG